MSITGLLELDFSQALVFVGDVLRNPTSNLTAFVLILVAFTIIVLLIIVVLLLIFSGAEEELARRTGEEVTDETPYRSRSTRARPWRYPPSEEEMATEASAAVPSEHVERSPRSWLRRVAEGLVWLLVVGIVWAIGGWVSAEDTLCISCHADDAPHAARLDGSAEDPHAAVACVECHETANVWALVSTAVPARAEHFIAGFMIESRAAGYGRPVKASTCSWCHAEQLRGVLEDTERGLLMEHAQPLEAGAACLDCHALRDDTGIVNRFTVGMTTCLRCHDAQKVSAECIYCHTRDVAYAMQSRATPKPAVLVSGIDCGGCHEQETCDACHGTRMPHSTEFMGAGHAREAAADIWFNGGRMCARCHTETRRPCTTCHQGTFPSHGSPSFAYEHQLTSPNGTGCDHCHGYNQWIRGRNFCAICHPEYPPILD